MRKLSKAQEVFRENPMDRLEVYSLLGAIYIKTCIRFERFSLSNLVEDKTKGKGIHGNKSYICSVLVKSGLLLTEGVTNMTRYKWNKEKFGPVSLKTADMFIEQVCEFKRDKGREYQRRRYANGKHANSPQRRKCQNNLND